MMTLSNAAAASPDQTAAARTNAAQSASVAASARKSVRDADAAGAANDARMAADKPPALVQSVPDMMSGIPTLAIAGSAQNSLPATLAQLNHLAVVGASGQLSEADRATLQAEYAQLTQQVTSVVGAASIAAQQAASDQRQQSDTDADRQDADDRRSTLARVDQQAPATVRAEPVEQLVRTVKSVPMTVGDGTRITPKVTLHTHELHVGADSYEPVQVRQTRTQLSRPEASITFAQQATIHRTLVAQVTQIASMSHVAQVSHVDVVA